MKNPEKNNEPEIVKHEYGFWQLANIPSKDELKEYYSTKYYQVEKGNYRLTYPAKEIEYINKKIGQKYFILTEEFKISGERSLLDIGCGEGFTLSYFHNMGWTVSGIDFSDYGCKQMNPQMLPNLVVGDVFQLIDEFISYKKTFDVLWLSNVLEHITDPVSLLINIKHLVSENGILVVQVPNDFSRLQNFLLESEKIDKKFWLAVPDHINYFDRVSLQNIAINTGWESLTLHADFPIDWYLVNENSNYVADKSLGKGAHQSRIDIELLIAENEMRSVNKFYESLANVGMGRQITAFLKNK